MRIAVFPGSFDPITRGHESVVNRASNLFDRIYIAIGINANKKYLFDLETRKRFIEIADNSFVDQGPNMVVLIQRIADFQTTVGLHDSLFDFVIDGFVNNQATG